MERRNTNRSKALAFGPKSQHFTISKSQTYALLYIILCGIVVYANSLFNGFVGDDNLQVVQNPLLHSVVHIPQFFEGSTFYNGTSQLIGLWYRPLMLCAYTVLTALFGTQSLPFHAFQVVLHIINAILVFYILCYFFKRSIALVLSLLFLVHPMNSEAISYIGDMDDILFFFFGSMALVLEIYMKEGIKKYIFISLLILCSLFSKESGVLFVLPLIAARLTIHKKNVFQLAGSLLFTLGIYGFFRIFVAHISYAPQLQSSPLTEASLVNRLPSVPSIFFYYIKTAFLPIHLAISQQWIIHSVMSLQFYAALGFDILLCVLLLICGIQIHKTHKMRFSTYMFFVVWFFSGMLMYSQLFIALDFTVSDNWFYFPLVGLLGIIGVFYQVYVPKKKAYVPIIQVSVGIILILLSIRTIVRNSNFHDNFTLVTHDIVYSTDSSALAYGLGNQYLNQGNLGKASIYLQRALQIDPNEPINWNTLGLLYEQEGKGTQAQMAFMHAINLNLYMPSFENLCLYLLLNNKLQQATEVTHKALLLYPTDGRLWMVQALIEHANGQNALALTSSKNALLYSRSNLTYILYLLLARHLPFTVMTAWTNNGLLLGLRQS